MFVLRTGRRDEHKQHNEKLLPHSELCNLLSFTHHVWFIKNTRLVTHWASSYPPPSDSAGLAEPAAACLRLPEPEHMEHHSSEVSPENNGTVIFFHFMLN